MNSLQWLISKQYIEADLGAGVICQPRPHGLKKAHLPHASPAGASCRRHHHHLPFAQQLQLVAVAAGEPVDVGSSSNSAEVATSAHLLARSAEHR